MFIVANGMYAVMLLLDCLFAWASMIFLAFHFYQYKALPDCSLAYICSELLDIILGASVLFLWGIEFFFWGGGRGAKLT